MPVSAGYQCIPEQKWNCGDDNCNYDLLPVIPDVAAFKRTEKCWSADDNSVKYQILVIQLSSL